MVKDEKEISTSSIFFPVDDEPLDVVGYLEKYIIRLMEFKEKAGRLVNAEKLNPFDINTHIQLAELYSGIGWYIEAEEEQEMIEFLSRIKRTIKNRRELR